MTIARDSSRSMAQSHGVTKPKTSNSFVEALNKKRRCRGRRTTTAFAQSTPIPRRSLGLSYEAAARLRPKLWTSGGRTNPPTQEQPPRLKIIRKRARGKISGRQVRAPEEDPAACGSAITGKKPRCVSSQTSQQSIQPRSPSFLTSDLLRRRYGGGGIVRRRRNERAVAFADPIVSEVRTRPRTPHNCIADLFYRRADEARFRREEQQRRKLLQQTCRTPSCEHEHEEDPNEVTESDNSSSSSDEDMDDQHEVDHDIL